jgi:hypothetical protein
MQCSLLGWVTQTGVGVEQTGGVFIGWQGASVFGHKRSQLKIGDEAISPQLHRVTYIFVVAVKVALSHSCSNKG